MAQLSPASADNVATASRIRTARTTGLWYLGLAICGLCGFLLIRSQLYAPGDPRQTLAQLGAQAWLARAGIAFELGIVITQALAAVRSEEHTSELQSLMRISYAVFCLKKKKNIDNVS